MRVRKLLSEKDFIWFGENLQKTEEENDIGGDGEEDCDQFL